MPALEGNSTSAESFSAFADWNLNCELVSVCSYPLRFELRSPWGNVLMLSILFLILTLALERPGLIHPTMGAEQLAKALQEPYSVLWLQLGYPLVDKAHEGTQAFIGDGHSLPLVLIKWEIRAIPALDLFLRYMA